MLNITGASLAQAEQQLSILIIDKTREDVVHECTTSESLQLNSALPFCSIIIVQSSAEAEAESSNNQMFAIQHGMNEVRRDIRLLSTTWTVNTAAVEMREPQLLEFLCSKLKNVWSCLIHCSAHLGVRESREEKKKI